MVSQFKDTVKPTNVVTSINPITLITAKTP